MAVKKVATEAEFQQAIKDLQKLSTDPKLSKIPGLQKTAAKIASTAPGVVSRGEATVKKLASDIGATYDPTTGVVSGPTESKTPAGPTGPTLTPEQIAANAKSDYEKQQAAAATAEELRRKGQSAYDILLTEFNQYGLGTLVTSVKGLITSGADGAQLTLALRQTEPYKKRFAANASRIASGLRALSEAEYTSLEDQYQNVMRNYGLPASYYTKDATGRQEGFEKFIAGDVSPTELEDRVMTAQSRVVNASPLVKDALKQFYPEIKDADILAYTLDPTKGLDEIKRKVTAAEIGGAAMGQNLQTSAKRAEELARFGVTAESARQGYQTIAEVAPRGSQLAAIYGEGPYGQTEAEQELFNLTGSAAAGEKRKKLTELERSAFSGQAGTTAGALSRDRAGSF
jgi:hypothetical protein